MLPKLLIVGAFSSTKGKENNRPVYGGILRSTEIIMNSESFNSFEIVPLDSSQISNPPPNILFRACFAARRILRIIKILAIEKPNASLIFCSDGLSALEKGLMIWLCDLFNCPSLIFPRAGNLINQISNSALMLRALRFLFGKAEIFLCQGQKWADTAINLLDFKSTNVLVINNWTATSQLISIGEQRIYDSSMEQTPRLLFVGWLEEFKGIFELLSVAKNLKDSLIDFHLSIAGRGDAEISAKRFVEDNDLEDHVRFLGWLDQKSLETELAQHDIFVLPSHEEGLPNAMVEALASGLAVIVTSVGLIPGYIIDKEHALLTIPKDIESLEFAVKSFILDQELRVSIAKRGHELAKGSFSTDVSLEKLSATIKNLIA